MTSPTPTTFRLPTETLRQLDALADAYGSNRTDALIRAIERQYTSVNDDLITRMVAGDNTATDLLTAQLLRYMQEHPEA